MAWVWWLSAPLVMTVLGAAVVGWRNHDGPGMRLARRRRPDPMADHVAFLGALPQPAPDRPPPATMVVTEVAQLEA